MTRGWLQHLMLLNKWAGGHDSLENTMLLHEKDQFKELCVKLGIRSPLSTCFEEEKDAAILWSRDQSKAVGQTSGICRADNRAEAIEAIHNSLKNLNE